MKKLVLLITSSILVLSSCAGSGDTSVAPTSSSSPSSLEPESFEPASSEIISEEPLSEGERAVPSDSRYQVMRGDSTIRFSNVLEDFKQNEYQSTYEYEGYYGGTFVNKLEKPSSQVTNIEEFSALLDYCAFYKEESLTFTLNYPYSKMIEEVRLAWWNSVLLPGVVGINLVNQEGSNGTVEFYYNDIADTYVPKDISDQKDVIPYIYRGEDETISDVLYTPTKGLLDVYNSDQLVYALVNGYEPVILNDYLAFIYNSAKNIVINNIHPNMTIQEKANALTWEIINNCVYDHPSDDAAAYIPTDIYDYFPDEASSTFCANYADGAFLYGTAFCTGFAKASAMLLALAGLEVRRVFSRAGSTLSDSINSHDPSKGYWTHGYNYVKEEHGKYVVNDPTYAMAGDVAYGGRITRMNTGFCGVEEWYNIYNNLHYDVFRSRNLDKMYEENPQWYEMFYLNDEKTIKPIVDSPDFSTVINAYKENIIKYRQINGDEMRVYHCNVAVSSLSDDKESRIYVQIFDNQVNDLIGSYSYAFGSAKNALLYGYTFFPAL